MVSRQPLFRAQAREHYAQSREQTVLPRLVRPPIFLCMWILLGMLVISTVLAWQVQVPLYATASGVMVSQPASSGLAANSTVVLFVPASPTPTFQVGASLTVQVTLSGASFPGTIIAVRPGVLTPAQIRQRYSLSRDESLLVTQPSVAIQVGLPSAADLQGLSLSAQVQVGSQSILVLLPHLLSQLFGG